MTEHLKMNVHISMKRVIGKKDYSQLQGKCKDPISKHFQGGRSHGKQSNKPQPLATIISLKMPDATSLAPSSQMALFRTCLLL